MELKSAGKKAREIFDRKPWKIVSYICLGFFPLFCYFLMEMMNVSALRYGDPGKAVDFLLAWMNESFLKIIFGLLVAYFLFFCLWLIFRKAWISAALFGLISFIFGFVNYTKLLMQGDPFVPMDISLLGQAGDLISFVQTVPPGFFFVFLVIALLWIFFLCLSKPDCPWKARIRYPLLLILLLAGVFFFADKNRTVEALNAFDLYLEDTSLQRSNYSENGFVCGFTINALSLNVAPPESYTEENVLSVLEPYSFTESRNEPYDVIIVLSESFFDIRELEGLTFSENPLPNYDKIIQSKNCVYGTMYTNALGGGTVRPEFQILSGLTTTILPGGATPYTYIHEDTETFLTNYKAAGYRTTAIHLYDTSFYGRGQAYGYIGFDEFIGPEELTPEIEPKYARSYISDETTEEAIEYYMDRNTADGTPSVVFAITMENHQPYGENPANTIEVTSDDFDDETAIAVNTYTQGLKDADLMLKELVSYVDHRERPTILLFYGDHKPTLGQVHTLYEKTGYYDSADDSAENRKKIFSAPFLIYANRDMDECFLTPGVSHKISDYHLLNVVASATGFQQTPYMNFLEDMYQVLPYYNMYLSLDDDLTEEQWSYVTEMNLISYDRICGKRYSCGELSR